MRATLLAVLILAIAPASALAGGWATVGLSSTPDGIAPGEPWVVELTILQHGRTPLDGLEPTLTVSRPGGQRRTLVAYPTGRAGVYRARVVFPAAGSWRYEVNDDFPGVVHEFPPAVIGDASAATPLPDGAPNVGLALLLAAAAGLGAGLIARMLRRGRGGTRPAEA